MTIFRTGVTPQIFVATDLACRCGCGTLKLLPNFFSKLQELQEACGFQFPINSCCRCPIHNGRVGGHPRSLHLTYNIERGLGGTCAIDIGFQEGHEYRQRLIDEAWCLGWSIGTHPRFVHVDRRSQYIGLPQAKFKY